MERISNEKTFISVTRPATLEVIAIRDRFAKPVDL